MKFWQEFVLVMVGSTIIQSMMIMFFFMIKANTQYNIIEKTDMYRGLIIVDMIVLIIFFIGVGLLEWYLQKKKKNKNV